MFRSSRVLQITALLALSFGAGTLLFLTARYWKRKRREPSTGNSSSYNDRPLRRKRTLTSGARFSAGESTPRPPAKSLSLEQDVMFRHHVSNVRSQSSNIEDIAITVNDGRISEDSAVELGDIITDEEEIIEELIKRGVENFEMALEHWYEAAEYVMTQRGQSHPQQGDSFFFFEADAKLNALISSSRKLRKVIEQYDLAVTSLPRTPSNMLTWIDDESLQEQLQMGMVRDLDLDDSSDADSFVSAADDAQLEFDDSTEERLVSESCKLKLFRQAVLRSAGCHSHLEFYVSGLQHYIRHGITCRKIRTSVVGCETDMEFLAKVHCIRQASEMVFSSSETRQWFIESGRQAVSTVIKQAGKDPSDFQAAFDELVEYTSSADNWRQIKDELSGRGVSHLSFYDVLLDFVLLDAFDDLETPPYTVATAVQNRWLSARIKETALTTAIWGVLKAKSSYLQDPYGFMAHFYVVAQYVSPVLAWGFLGTDEELKQVCEYFKSNILGFIKDIFDFDSSDYSTTESLRDSIVRLAKERGELLLRGQIEDTDVLETTDSFGESQSLQKVKQC